MVHFFSLLLGTPPLIAEPQVPRSVVSSQGLTGVPPWEQPDDPSSASNGNAASALGGAAGGAVGGAGAAGEAEVGRVVYWCVLSLPLGNSTYMR